MDVVLCLLTGVLEMGDPFIYLSTRSNVAGYAPVLHHALPCAPPSLYSMLHAPFLL